MASSLEYDLNEMRIGRALDHSHDAYVVPHDLPMPRKTKVKYAVLAAVLGVVLKGGKENVTPEVAKAEPDKCDEGAHREG
ncbi:MAG: hypothetical protein ABI806_16955 [Candidatus Solibacter sp.]